MPRTTFIPSATFDAMTENLAADIASLTPDIDGSISHKVAEVLTRYGLAPADVAHQIVEDMRAHYSRQTLDSMISQATRQIIDDMCDEARRQAESMVPAMARPAA